MAISVIDTTLVSMIKNSYALDNNLIEIVEELQGLLQFAGYELRWGLLRKKNKIVIGLNEQLRAKLISWQHASPKRGHSGRDITTRRLKGLFY